jgi:hypothetical protein
MDAAKWKAAATLGMLPISHHITAHMPDGVTLGTSLSPHPAVVIRGDGHEQTMVVI